AGRSSPPRNARSRHATTPPSFSDEGRASIRPAPGTASDQRLAPRRGRLQPTDQSGQGLARHRQSQVLAVVPARHLDDFAVRTADPPEELALIALECSRGQQRQRGEPVPLHPPDAVDRDTTAPVPPFAPYGALEGPDPPVEALHPDGEENGQDEDDGGDRGHTQPCDPRRRQRVTLSSDTGPGRVLDHHGDRVLVHRDEPLVDLELDLL